jgi:putative membrane protein
MLGFILRGLIAALGLWLATAWVQGVSVNAPATLVLAGLLLGVVNAIVRPLVLILTLPITVVTIGFFLLVINAAMVGLVAWLLPGFNLAGFWPAFWTAILISVTSWFGSMLIGPKGRIEIVRHPKG